MNTLPQSDWLTANEVAEHLAVKNGRQAADKQAEQESRKPVPISIKDDQRRGNSMDEQTDTDFHQRLAELFRETEGDLVDILSGRVTVKEARAKDREVRKRLKALEQEMKRNRMPGKYGQS